METTTGQVSTRQSRRPRLLWSWSRDLLLALALGSIPILYINFKNKFVYKLEPIERGDIVVFHYPFDPSKSYIKRVIGLSGDRVRIVEGQVYVNERPLKETYVPGNYFDYRSLAEVTVPPHAYFVLGDHRSLSNDSRDFGPVAESYIYGKAVFVYWPMEKLGILR